MKISSLFLIILVALGLMIHSAEAARFGAGRSFGMQRSIGSFSRYQQPAKMIPQQSRPASRWLAPLAGLAMGGLLAYLLMGHGIGAGVLSWLAILSIVAILWHLLRRSLQPQVPSMQNNNQFQNNMMDINAFSPQRNNYSTHAPAFEPDNFLREAKVQFIRLQAAYDAKDLNDLCEFTAPEVFAEIQLQIQERGDAVNKTEVISLNAELLDVDAEGRLTVASVKFSGTIREGCHEPVTSFSEIWHFRKNTLGNKWIVTGVQQMQ